MRTSLTGERVLVQGQPLKPADLDCWDEIWCVDFEYRQPDGEYPEIRCMVARECKTDRLIRKWGDKLLRMKRAPFRTDKRVLFVAYFASAELGCFLELGWPLPERILDLFVEFRNHTNNRPAVGGNGLLSCMAYFDLVPLGTEEKKEMRELAIRPGDWKSYTDEERVRLMDYCQTDVDALQLLLPRMQHTIDLPRALLRGRYMTAVAKMERTGIPLDVPSLHCLKDNWEKIKFHLVDEVDKDYGVFDDYSFKASKFAEWLAGQGMPWPRLPDRVGPDGQPKHGGLALDDDTFRQMARKYPQVAALREVRHALGEMRLFENIACGPDGRNRCMLSPFSSRTGRNQPSNAKFIFGTSAWIRGLIKPGPGRFLAYVDWSQQEFGIAAWLSGDKNMQAAYDADDPYLTFAKMAEAVPEDATKDSHPNERKRFKVCALAVLFGQTEWGMARALDCQEAETRRLIRKHQEVFPDFWKWSEAAIDHAMLKGWTSTVFGWRLHTRLWGDQNPRSLSNLPVQGNGAEMMRLAACMLTEAGIEVHAPVHDAFLVGGSLQELDLTLESTQIMMAEAAYKTIGKRLKSDVKIVAYPDRYMEEERGRRTWEATFDLIKFNPDTGEPDAE